MYMCKRVLAYVYTYIRLPFVRVYACTVCVYALMHAHVFWACVRLVSARIFVHVCTHNDSQTCARSRANALELDIVCVYVCVCTDTEKSKGAKKIQKIRIN